MQGRLGFIDEVNLFSVDGAVPAIDAGASAIAAGLDHACAVRDGSVWCWGGNDFGQVGIGTFTPGIAQLPAAVPGLSGVDSLTLGTWYSCALSTDASAKCWGFNSYGQLGNGTTADAASPSPVVTSLAP
jgi:alpha-tubulin suppressor-like RCC1 family protein